MLTTELQWKEHRKYFGNMGAHFPSVFWGDLSKPFLLLVRILEWIYFHRSDKTSFPCGSTHWLGTVFSQLRSASTGKSHGASSQSESVNRNFSVRGKVMWKPQGNLRLWGTLKFFFFSLTCSLWFFCLWEILRLTTYD